MPRSTACWKNGPASSSPKAHSLNPREVSPKLMHPNAIRLTFRPESPRRLYSMINFLPRLGSPLSLSKHPNISVRGAGLILVLTDPRRRFDRRGFVNEVILG